MAARDVMATVRGMVLNKSVRILEAPLVVDAGAGSIGWRDLPIHPMPTQKTANYFTHLLEVCVHATPHRPNISDFLGT